jgi:hypothetical protein
LITVVLLASFHNHSFASLVAKHDERSYRRRVEIVDTSQKNVDAGAFLTLHWSVCDFLRRRTRHCLKICRIMTSLLTIVCLIMRTVLLSRGNEADIVRRVLSQTRRCLRLRENIFASIRCVRSESGIRVCLIGTRAWLTVCRLHVSHMPR